MPVKESWPKAEKSALKPIREYESNKPAKKSRKYNPPKTNDIFSKQLGNICLSWFWVSNVCREE